MSASDPTRRGIDTLGIRDATLALGPSLAAAVEIGEAIDHLPAGEDVANVLVVGMGADGLVGDVLHAVGDLFLPVPVTVAKGYDAPSFVGPDTFVVAVSHSGETEETLQAAEEAIQSGARLLAVTSGGTLAELAGGENAALALVPDAPAARTALGSMLAPPLLALERMGIFPGAHGWIDAAVDQLERRALQLSSDRSPAADLARRIGRTIPIVYGSGAVGRATAARWKTQINENAKAPAFANFLSEVCHNEVAGWGQNGDLTRQVFQLVFLRHDEEHPRQAERYRALETMLEEVVGAVHQVEAEGDGALAQILDLVLYGDVVSLELAGQEGLDPGPVPAVDDLARMLEA
ncbi:MAG: bifunctional phosphoglucose/phosphomannose isomerase [Acidimicrobiales bacterium]|nr:bifunctional phosphoglucose/phosphomannose isomerase [Acidimicrobiales bacterium]